MDHSAPILASFEVLPDMLTAKDLEAFVELHLKALNGWSSGVTGH
jgi:hypothetical protein